MRGKVGSGGIEGILLNGIIGKDIKKTLVIILKISLDILKKNDT
jgi:hypothetical protein